MKYSVVEYAPAVGGGYAMRDIGEHGINVFSSERSLYKYIANMRRFGFAFDVKEWNDDDYKGLVLDAHRANVRLHKDPEGF